MTLSAEDLDHARQTARAAPEPTPDSVARIAAVIRENQRSNQAAA